MSNPDVLFLDFEFGLTAEPVFKPLCVATHDGRTGEVKSYNLTNKMGVVNFSEVIDPCRPLGCFNVMAEAACYIQLRRSYPELFLVDVKGLEWIDLFTLFKFYLNGRMSGTKPNLLNAQSILLGVDVEEHKAQKEAMRDLVIKYQAEVEMDPKVEFPQNRMSDLMDYCMEDVEHLPAILVALKDRLKPCWAWPGVRNAGEFFLEPGRYGAHLAECTLRGIPVDRDKLDRMSVFLPAKEIELQKKYMGWIPDMIYQKKVKGVTTYSKSKKNFDHAVECSADHLRERGIEWPKKPPTNTNIKKTFEENFPSIERASVKKMTEVLKQNGLFWDCGNYRGDQDILEVLVPHLPEGKHKEFLELWLCYHLEAAPLEFFKDKEGERPWWAYIGSDWMLRPNFNPYGSQTYRNYAKANSFYPAKAKHIASTIVVPEGYALIELDYCQQEFYLAGLISGDKAMMSDYESGDPYVGFATRVGSWDKKRETRQKFKNTILGLQYGMWVKTMQWYLSYALKRLVSEEEAEGLINEHKTHYYTYHHWRDEIFGRYQKGEPLFLPDRSPLWPGNPSQRSTTNFPIQGTGGVLLRRATMRVENRHPFPKVLFPYHDALYFLVLNKLVPEVISSGHSAMLDVFVELFPASKPRIEAKVISPDTERLPELPVISGGKVEILHGSNLRKR